MFYSAQKWETDETRGQARRQNLSERGAKKQKGWATFLKYSIGCMQQPVGQTWHEGAPISNGGGHHWPSAGDDLLEAKVSRKK